MKKYLFELLRLLIIFLIGVGIILLFLPLIKQKKGIGMLDSVTPISIQGMVSIDGGSHVEVMDSIWQDDIRSSLSVTGHFNHNIQNGNSLILWPRNLRIKLYVNNILKLSIGQRESFPDFIQYAGNSYQIFYIGNVYTTDTIRLEINKAYESCRINVITDFFQHLYIGQEGAVYQSIFSNEMIHPLIGLILVLVGILVLISSVFRQFNHQQQMRHIHYLGWFCIVGGISYICDSSYEFIDLLFPHPVFNTLIDLCCIPVLLFFYLLYTTSVLQNTKTKKYMRWVTVIFIILELTPILLQIFGILDLHVVQDQYVYMGGVMILLSLWAILYEIFYLNNSEMKKVLITAVPLIWGLFFKIGNVVLERGVERSYLRIGILISFLFILYNTYKYIQYSVQLIEQEQQMKQDIQNAHISIMLSQIQPHFLYNALNTLQHICKKDGALAAEAIEHFSRYLRGNMDSLTSDVLIPFTKELEHVNHYLYIEKLRFGERIQIKYDLRYTSFYLPTLTLQPIVENAVRHGITKQAEGGVITIITKLVKDEVWIIVDDNGVGFQPIDQSLQDRRHIGIENVRNRLELQCNGTISIVSKKNVGTQVTIRLKGMNKNENHGR